MHVLAVNSVSTLLNYLSEQLQNTPALEDIQGWNKDHGEPDTPKDSMDNIKQKTASVAKTEPIKKEEEVRLMQ